MVKQMLINKSAPQPATMNTPIGGTRMVIRTMRRAGMVSELDIVTGCGFGALKRVSLLLVCETGRLDRTVRVSEVRTVVKGASCVSVT